MTTAVFTLTGTRTCSPSEYHRCRFVALHNMLGDNVPTVIYPIFMGVDHVPQVFDHISMASTGRGMLWTDFVTTTRAQGESKPWIRFEAVMLGDQDIQRTLIAHNHSQLQPAGFHNNIRWLGLRSWILKAAGLDPHYRPITPRIVLNNKNTEDGAHKGKLDRRRIANIDDIEMHIASTFPGTQVCTMRVG